jgi:hypothetical protein
LVSPLNGDPDSTQILTWHYSAQSETARQLVSLEETTPPSQSSQLTPSGLSKHLRMGSVQIPQHILTTRMELWGFIKSSMLYQSVHKELSLHLSFYLRRSLGGYTVGTTAGFLVKIVEAFAPSSRHRIPWNCLQHHMRTCSAHCQLTNSCYPLNGGLRGFYRGKALGTMGHRLHHKILDRTSFL